MTFKFQTAAMKSTPSLSKMTRLILPIGLAVAPAAAQSAGFMTLFLPDSEPLSLEASAVAINTVTAGRADTRGVTTVVVACPTAASPENDACRAAGIYPAQVYHTQGSVWGGTTTYSADDSTTTWVCSLGGSGASLTGDCTKTIVGGSSTRTETSQYDDCYVMAHQRPVVMTAGVKIQDGWGLRGSDTMDASQYISIRSSLLSSAGCPASQTVMWAGAVASTTSAAGSAGVTAAPSTGPSAATTAVSPTQTAPSPATSSTNGAGRAGNGLMAALSLGIGAALMLW